MEAMLNRLAKMQERYDEINSLLISDEILSKPKEMTKLAKEQSKLNKPVESYQRLLTILNDLEAANEMLNDSDAEMKAMAEMEIEELSTEKATLVEKLEVMLIPKDPADDHDCIVEIRGAAGGDEGNIFAGDLYRMYNYYAEAKGFKVQVLESSEAESGGYTLISFLIKGEEAYRHFKFESGSHRVQRVPKTESQGRVHTSTATVLVLPDAEEDDVEINDADLTIETHRATGAGGQHINKTDSAVRIVHLPTGISVNCQEGRSQIQNREIAMRIIRARVFEEYERQRMEAEGAIRKEKMGTGDRAEKIRTYNYPQNRVTDHRISLTINQLDRIVEGKLNDIVDALLANEQKEKLAGEDDANL